MPDPLLLAFVLVRIAGGGGLVYLGVRHRRGVIVGLGAAVLAHAVPGILAAFHQRPTDLLTATSSGAAIAFVAFALAATTRSRTESTRSTAEIASLKAALARLAAIEPPTDRTSR